MAVYLHHVATDYNAYYKDHPNGLGKPFPEVVQFFQQLVPPLLVLDLGCGQGRDSLFIAGLGHQVVAIDIAESGIQQLQTQASKKGLDISAEVADVLTYNPETHFDVILADRTLHMISPERKRLEVLYKAIASLKPKAYLLIADERKNLPAFKEILVEKNASILMHKKGFLFSQMPAA